MNWQLFQDKNKKNVKSETLHCWQTRVFHLINAMHLYVYVLQASSLIHYLYRNKIVSKTTKSLGLCSLNVKKSSWWRRQMKQNPRYWPFVRGIHRLLVYSPHKGQWRGALVFPLISAWTNGCTVRFDVYPGFGEHPAAWMSNHIPCRVWGEIAYPLPNVNGR